MSGRRRLFAATITVAACLSSASPVAAQTRTYELKPVFDTYVNGAAPSRSYVGARTLSVGRQPRERAYLRFNLRPVRGRISRAFLQLRVRPGAGAARFVVRRAAAGNPWGFNFLTAPSTTRRLAHGRARRGWIEVDVTRAARRRKVFRLAVTSSSRRGFRFSSRDSSRSPRLLVETRPPTYLDNGVVRVGVDLAKGGTIAYLAQSGGGENVINNYDLGRQVQQSYYAGPRPYGDPAPPWDHAAWNPIGSGDRYGHPSEVLESTNDGTTLYVKSRPKQWALDNVPCECVFEQWLALQGNAVAVRNRFTNSRSDTRQYAAMTQELPAVYAIGTLDKLVSYTGPSPYTGDHARELDSVSSSVSFQATEHWAALVNDAGWGLGVFAPEVSTFYGRFFGTPGVGSTSDFSTNYVAPTTREVLDHDISYEYDYSLVLGTVDEIRWYATNRSLLAGQGPTYRFDADRDHWSYANTADAGWPITGFLRVGLEQADPNMIGPLERWAAADAPKLYIRAAYYNARRSNAQLFWRRPGEAFSPARSLRFSVRPDGQFHTYELNLEDQPDYDGQMVQLRFDPSEGGYAGAYVDVDSISSTPLGP